MQLESRNSLDGEQNEPLLFGNISPLQSNGSITWNKTQFQLIAILLAMVILVESGTAMVSAPTIRIYEAIVCQRYYGQYDSSKVGIGGRVPEELCKIEEVQGEVAIVQGIGDLFNALLGVILAIPYGLFADKYGRKFVLRLSIPGYVLNMLLTAIILWYSNSIPLRMVWLSSLAWLVGGGIVVAGTNIWTMMADVTNESQRAAIFFQFGVATMGADVLASAVSSWSMAHDPWIPMFLGWAITLLGILPALALPETSSVLNSKNAAEASYEIRSPSSPIEHRFTIAGRGLRNISIGGLLGSATSCVSAYAFILQDRKLLPLLCTFLVFNLSRGTTWFLVQYSSKRFEWTIAKANYLVSVKAALTVVLFVAILPATSWYLITRIRMHTRMKDLTLMNASILFLIIGSLGMGLSTSISLMVISLLIQTLGAGFAFVTRSLMTTMVREDQIARLYTIIEIMEAVGMVITGPVVACFFNWGLELGGVWIGLPWMVMCCLFIATGVAVWTCRLPLASKLGEDG